MMIPLSEAIAKHGFKIKGVIHVGAHIGQEFDEYEKDGIYNVAFIEPMKEAYAVLGNTFMTTEFKTNHPLVKVELFQCALGAYDGEARMHVETANQGMSNSILQPSKHLQAYPSITFDKSEMVSIHKLDTLIKDGVIDIAEYNMLNMDVQGYEMEVLKGAIKTLPFINYIYTEVNTEEIYKGCARLDQMDLFLADHGFQRCELKMTDVGWGDAIYVRTRMSEHLSVVNEVAQTPGAKLPDESLFQEPFIQVCDSVQDAIQSNDHLSPQAKEAIGKIASASLAFIKGILDQRSL